MARPLTSDESELFDALRDPDIGNFALVQVTYRGEETAAIAACTIDQESGDFILTPVALLTTDAMVDDIVNPTLEPVES
jgi:hypothetical protein